MYSTISRAVPLPLSLVHPQWLQDVPADDVSAPWIMTFDVSDASEEGEEEDGEEEKEKEKKKEENLSTRQQH